MSIFFVSNKYFSILTKFFPPLFIHQTNDIRRSADRSKTRKTGVHNFRRVSQSPGAVSHGCAVIVRRPLVSKLFVIYFLLCQYLRPSAIALNSASSLLGSGTRTRRSVRGISRRKGGGGLCNFVTRLADDKGSIK